MAVLKLPVEPREMSVALIKRRSAQESVFTGAVQHVIAAGSIWQGYMDLPPILEQSTWAECRAAIQSAIENDEDRLAVPIVEGEVNLAIKAGSPLTSDTQTLYDIRDGVFEWKCHLHVDGEYLVVETFDLINFEWNPPIKGAWITAIWHDGTEKIVRAATSQATRIVHPILSQSDFAAQGIPDYTEYTQTPLLNLQLHYPTGYDSSYYRNGLQLRATAFRLNPPIPHMFREATDDPGGKWSVMQAQVSRPFIPAIVLNDDALGHTISDRAVIPNRIEFVSSSVY